MDWRPLILLCFIGGVFAAKPTLKPSVEVLEKTANESFAVFCIPPPGTNEELTWTDPKNRAIANTGRVHVESRGSIGQMLLFDRVDTADSGRYTCTSSSKDTVSFHLSVFRPITFKSKNVQTIMEYASKPIISCEALGEPKPTVSWLKNGDIVKGPKYVPIDKGLMIMNASRLDTGNLTCRAIQVGNKDASSMKDFEINVQVQHKPGWKNPISGTEIVYGYIGGETNLTCETVANPPANFTWYRNNKEVRYQHNLNTTELHDRDRSVLTIYIKDDSAYSEFQCQAKNFMGSIKRSFKIDKGEKPPPPKNIRVVGTTVHEAHLEMDNVLDKADWLIGYRAQFVISLPGQEASWNKPDYQDMEKLNDREDKYKIIDLLEDTSYLVRVATHSRSGLSDFSNTTVLLRTLKFGVSSCPRTVPLLVTLLINLVIVFLAVH